MDAEGAFAGGLAGLGPAAEQVNFEACQVRAPAHCLKMLINRCPGETIPTGDGGLGFFIGAAHNRGQDFRGQAKARVAGLREEVKYSQGGIREGTRFDLTSRNGGGIFDGIKIIIVSARPFVIAVE